MCQGEARGKVCGKVTCCAEIGIRGRSSTEIYSATADTETAI